MLQGFKQFIMRGNVVDLAVAVVIGAAFAAVIAAFVKGIVTPLIAAIFGAVLWVLIDWGVLALGNSSVTIWLGILALSLILGIGLSWSILRQRLSGQATVEEVDG